MASKIYNFVTYGSIVEHFIFLLLKIALKKLSQTSVLPFWKNIKMIYLKIKRRSVNSKLRSIFKAVFNILITNQRLITWINSLRWFFLFMIKNQLLKSRQIQTETESYAEPSKVPRHIDAELRIVSISPRLSGFVNLSQSHIRPAQFELGPWLVCLTNFTVLMVKIFQFSK